MSSTNYIDASGINIQELSDVLNELLNGAAGYPGFYQIYGADINVQPNSPDGQMINIFAQAKVDVLQLAVQIYDSLDPDQAIGTSLDRCCAYNGVYRKAGTYTQQNVSVTVAQGLTLPGLDTNPTGGAFTVQDGTGNQYSLVSANTFGGAGTSSLLFQAVMLGPISSAPGAITTIATPQIGVSSVTNPAGPITVGTNEETDAALRIRRENSVAIPSQGFVAGLKAAILAIAGVSTAIVLENATPAVDGNGQAPNSIWVIVNALSTAYVSIAYAIYNERSMGCFIMNSGNGAVATANLTAMAVSSVTVGTAGLEYYNAPTVTFVGGGGTGATGHATISAGGVATVVVDTGGSGYTSAPAVVFNPNTIEETIFNPDNSLFIVYFDTAISQPLWFECTVTAITGTVDKTFIKNQILATFGTAYDIGEAADATEIVAYIKQIAPNASVTLEGVSTDGMSYSAVVNPTGVNYQFTIPDLAHLAIS